METLTAACRCQRERFSLEIPREKLPLKTHVCHCSVCRYIHGALCSFHATLPSGIQPTFLTASGRDELTSYTPSGSEWTRYFCSTCGCQVGDCRELCGDWVVSTAILEGSSAHREAVLDVPSHQHVDSALDGGLSRVLLPSTADLTIVGARDHAEIYCSTESSPPEELLAQCHCGGVSFKIHRPRVNLLDQPDAPKWAIPGHPPKWLAVLDVCDDCRLVSGANIMGWMFVSVDHVTPSLPPDLLCGTSQVYQSSPDARRTFCGTCGATVFYGSVDRPGLVDVAVGLLHAPEGAMADHWLSWRMGQLAWAADGQRYDARLTQQLVVGMRDWDSRHHRHVDSTVG